MRSAHQVQHFRRSCLLLQRLVQFAGEPSDRNLLTSIGQIGMCYGLGCIARFGFSALRRGALTGSLPALERLFIAFSVGSGVGIVAARRAAPEVAYSCSSNEP